jgi:hypothetical protein
MDSSVKICTFDCKAVLREFCRYAMLLCMDSRYFTGSFIKLCDIQRSKNKSIDKFNLKRYN